MNDFIKRYKTEEFLVDGVKFTVHPFPAIEALRIKATLLKKLSPALSKLLSGLEKDADKIENTDFDISKLGEGVQDLLDGLSEEEFVSLIKRLLKNTTAIVDVDGKLEQLDLSKDSDFDTVFRTKLMTVYTVIGHVLSVNYPDFFAFMGSIGEKLQTVSSDLLKSNGKK